MSATMWASFWWGAEHPWHIVIWGLLAGVGLAGVCVVLHIMDESKEK
jgi:hypothetical protein